MTSRRATRQPAQPVRGVVSGTVAAMGGTHAPQLVAPPKGDLEQIGTVQQAMSELQRRISKVNPDALIIFTGDHATNFFDIVPGFAVYCSEEISGSFSGYSHSYSVDYELAQELLESSLENGFDVASCFRASLDPALLVALHYLVPDEDVPVVPVFINQYLAPQPTPLRCYSWGQALGRFVQEGDKRVAFFGSGGMSHYPGTSRYTDPDLEWDQVVLQWLREGNGKALVDLTTDELDEHGNLELLQWCAVLGLVGLDRPAEVLTYAKGENHGYAVLDWKAL